MALKSSSSISSSPKEDGPRVLLITTSGGGGHLQAAFAKKLELIEKDPRVKIFEKDIAKSAGGKCFGYFMIDCIWNTAQRKGSILALDLCGYSIPTFDKLFWISIFFQIFFLLISKKIERVIDTQPMCSSSITSAVRLYNFIFEKNIKIEKVLTELPTKQSSHYLKPIKNLSSKNRSLIQLLAAPPFLENEISEAGFWDIYSGLKPSQILSDGLPIRPCFKKLHLHSGILNLKIQPKSTEESILLKNALKKSSLSLSLAGDELEISVPSNHLVITLMLGSQPHQQASLDYVESIANFVKNDPLKRHVSFFVFCADKKFEKIPLQKRIADLIFSKTLKVKNLNVIPLSSQPDTIIAPLYSRSQVTITKAGGITSMELLACSKGKIFIHHENNVSLFSSKHSLGMPKWEYGNALYLRNKKGATFVTPSSIYKELAIHFSNTSVDQEALKQSLSNFS